MDKEMMTLSLEEEDEPFVMPNLPVFKSSERNSRSLIGRILNPDCQKMPGLIQDMPRKWQKQGKVRGIALSKERFQFIFDHEHDLEEVLEKGVHTFNEWTLAIDRWMEKPPADYLQFIPIWVQIKNLPVNYYTKEAITELGEKILGEVMMVAFDPDKPQLNDYVRVRIRFDVSKPLRKTKIINLPEGDSVELRFNYERIQKRCYECQRLNHERDLCPLLVKKRRDAAAERRARIMKENSQREAFLAQDDPLFGVLSEDQVGICKMTGKRKIAPEVLDEMRRYLRTATEADKLIRIDRVRSSVADAEKDPITQKTVLRLEAEPIFTSQVDKGKGIVYDFDLNAPSKTKEVDGSSEMKLMGSAIQANKGDNLRQHIEDLKLIKENEKTQKDLQLPESSLPEFSSSKELVFFDKTPTRCGINSTEYGPGNFVSQPSGVSYKSSKTRRRPYLKKRQNQKRASTGILQELYGEKEGSESPRLKRKMECVGSEDNKVAWRKEPRVVPIEGPPKSQ